ncbi:hypothetical protein SB759_28005 [Pseudomonas sp. SIMBA_059]
MAVIITGTTIMTTGTTTRAMTTIRGEAVATMVVGMTAIKVVIATTGMTDA